jgi:hypothetical protein
VRVAGFGVEQKFVGQQFREFPGDGFAVFVGDANVRVHKI